MIRKTVEKALWQPNYEIIIRTYLQCFLFQPIVYEGQDKNPEMCRVLLTHEVMCRYHSILFT